MLQIYGMQIEEKDKLITDMYEALTKALKHLKSPWSYSESRASNIFRIQQALQKAEGKL